MGKSSAETVVMTGSPDYITCTKVRSAAGGKNLGTYAVSIRTESGFEMTLLNKKKINPY
ncbi:hypothetical protein [Hespellia stercorisuis]|uniref:Uncharacterized protein n=1 Tax=Hespellia stercorisuis DSM 15480 TaxID=1121950 RepID=A0A1M6LCE6_9FIRM|nr:hypothetical protein [Hespellia stercorisuis]SHJ68832.1 hypothetical protein SAMN02745243_01144 [Hespellia stercorisuis DSM 15480]